MAEYISKQSVLDYLNGYLHSIGEYNLLLDIGQRRALTNAIQDICNRSRRRTACCSCKVENKLRRLLSVLFSLLRKTEELTKYCPDCGARMGRAENDS